MATSLSPPRVAAASLTPAPARESQQGPPESGSISAIGLGTERTLVLVLATDCQACEESMNFYKKLLHQPLMDGEKGRVVVLATNGAVPVKKMLDKHEFKPHRILSYPIMSKIEISSETPGILVVDRTGRRVGLWSGRLSPSQEAEVLAAISAAEKKAAEDERMVKWSWCGANDY